MQSPIRNASEYVEELQRCIGDALEKCGVRYAGSYSDMSTGGKEDPQQGRLDNGCKCFGIIDPFVLAEPLGNKVCLVPGDFSIRTMLLLENKSTADNVLNSG